MLDGGLPDGRLVIVAVGGAPVLGVRVSSLVVTIVSSVTDGRPVVLTSPLVSARTVVP